MNKILPKGHASILSPTFKYVPAANTDLTKTFARIREQHASLARQSVRVIARKRNET